MKYFSFVCLLMASTCQWFASCDKQSRLKELVQLIASRQDLESVARQEDTATILEKLNYLELQLNGSHGNFQCSNTGQQKNDPGLTRQFKTPLENVSLMKVTSTFNEEQKSIKLLQRQVPKVNKTVNILGKMLDNFTNVVESIRDETSSSGLIKDFFNPILMDFAGTLDKLNKAVQNLSATVDDMAERSSGAAGATRMDSCLSHYKQGKTGNGEYIVFPLNNNHPVRVFCDMNTDGGGWTVFQRRIDGSVDFLRDWQDYKQGFGSLYGEFWLGNDNIAGLTSSCCHELRIEFEDFSGVRKYAKYGKFRVSPESKDYKLLVRRYSGNNGDSLSYHNRMKFSTVDRDNDIHSSNCTDMFKGAWWYKNCYYSNLNGMYFKEPKTVDGKGVNWNTWRENVRVTYSLKMTEMKLR